MCTLYSLFWRNFRSSDYAKQQLLVFLSENLIRSLLYCFPGSHVPANLRISCSWKPTNIWASKYLIVYFRCLYHCCQVILKITTWVTVHVLLDHRLFSTGDKSILSFRMLENWLKIALLQTIAHHDSYGKVIGSERRHLVGTIIQSNLSFLCLNFVTRW